MKKNYILSLAFLISFNAYGMDKISSIIKGKDTELGTKCNKFFECLRAQSLDAFKGAKEE
jgi:hypothetical protein